MNRWLRRSRLAVAALMLACGGLFAWQLVDYFRLARLERQLAEARSSSQGSGLSTPAARLARAQVLLRGSGSTAAGQALDLYREVEAEGSDALRRIARFDTANLYLRQAQQEIAAGEPARAVPLIELAKGLYRSLLRDDPSDWDLRYNLERAVRLLPEDDPEATEAIQAAPENQERAPTTMRGTSMGLP
jgi:mxaK protein